MNRIAPFLLGTMRFAASCATRKPPNAETAIKQLNENTKPQDYARVFVPGGGKRIGGALDKITVGNQDVEQVFADLDKETQQVIDRDITPKLNK